MKKSKAQERKETEEYVKFLEKRLASSNYKANVTENEYKKEQEKLKKARFRLKIL